MDIFEKFILTNKSLNPESDGPLLHVTPPLSLYLPISCLSQLSSQLKGEIPPHAPPTPCKIKVQLSKCVLTICLI